LRVVDLLTRFAIALDVVTKSLVVEVFGMGWQLVPGEAAAHGDDHGPVDDGLVVLGETFVVADGASAAGDPGQRPLDDPPAGQDLEGVQVIGPADDFQRQLRLELARGPGDELSGVAAVGPGELDRGEGAADVPQQGLAASRSWMPAAVISTVSSRPSVSTAMCRLRPLIFLPAQNPRPFVATVWAALTDWESMIAADG
jgi:hypothetical protein